MDWFEHRATHELVGLGEVYPAHFGQFLLVADEGLNPVSWAGGQVDHLAPSLGVDTTADNFGGAYPQACFLLDLAYRCVGGVFSGLDLARDECPRRLAIIASSH